jgi:hypothetical protein
VGLVPIGFGFLTAFCLLFVSLPVSAFDKTCASVKHSAPSDPGNAIEFVFAKPYACGQYANGDWWVSAGTDDYVEIVSILPEARDGLSGFEVSPSSPSKQGFDRRVAGYDRSLQPNLPLRLSDNASVVKAVSANAGKSNCLPCLQYAAVLTVLAKPLANSAEAFRPSYFGKAKFSYSVDSIGKKGLPRLSASCCSTAKELSFNTLAMRYAGVQLDHLGGWGGRSMHPINNMPNYGASIALDSSTAVLRMLLDDFDLAKPVHRAALIGYLQMSIDLLSMAENGVLWGPDGGHGNGRKLPLLFGGYLLGEDVFYKAANKSVFSEDEQVYFSAVANKALYGRKCRDADYWMQQRLGKGPKDCRDPYGYVDGGGQEIGDGYQFCCTAMPWKYTALAIRLLGLEREWNNDAFLQYVDRWVNHGAWASPDPCAPYNKNPAGYGMHYGPTASGRCIEGAGRFIDKHGSKKGGGHYGSRFGDQVWQWYTSRN